MHYVLAEPYYAVAAAVAIKIQAQNAFCTHSSQLIQDVISSNEMSLLKVLFCQPPFQPRTFFSSAQTIYYFCLITPLYCCRTIHLKESSTDFRLESRFKKFCFVRYEPRTFFQNCLDHLLKYFCSFETSRYFFKYLYKNMLKGQFFHYTVVLLYYNKYTLFALDFGLVYMSVHEFNSMVSRVRKEGVRCNLLLYMCFLFLDFLRRISRYTIITNNCVLYTLFFLSFCHFSNYKLPPQK